MKEILGKYTEKRKKNKQIKRKWKISLYESKQKPSGMELATVYTIGADWHNTERGVSGVIGENQKRRNENGKLEKILNFKQKRFFI